MDWTMPRFIGAVDHPVYFVGGMLSELALEASAILIPLYLTEHKKEFLAANILLKAALRLPQLGRRLYF